ncbi:acetylglutamate/acetylaminoadipate kinase [Halorussus gelatinilyticus]|uniref:Putative [LysW]-aminoadipate/[LysW]-glutamate kinase n=1 Tax=Halorussus gelatinilyticus TaxID=2937524 RepID=A0A8U0INB8_9EURY|nr:acetylglutamate/acetylaminoadipate kinase [Halorussus gelatinilyticus]UPW01674.1 acetylglutamate/acetylaminoadipate kinase [Halorussus gelatinilyticus]
MTEYTEAELEAAHEQLIDNDLGDDGLRTDGGAVGADDQNAPIVVKIGGARAVNPEDALADVAHLVANGEDVVVVHGGSTAVDDTLERLGEDPEYVETPGGVVGRFTDETTMEVFEMVLPGKLNTDLVAGLQNQGVNAVGLSGADGKLLTGPRKSAVKVVEDGRKKIKRGDHSGKIEAVNDDLLSTLLAGSYVPVVTVPMLAEESSGEGTATEFTPVNADADRAAAAVAGALGGELVVLTDVEGVYEDPEDSDSLIESVGTPAELDAAEDAAEGFMTKKVMAAVEALEGGAASVTVADANNRDPITAARTGHGTTFEPEAVR